MKASLSALTKTGSTDFYKICFYARGYIDNTLIIILGNAPDHIQKIDEVINRFSHSRPRQRISKIEEAQSNHIDRPHQRISQIEEAQSNHIDTSMGRRFYRYQDNNDKRIFIGFSKFSLSTPIPTNHSLQPTNHSLEL